MNTSGLYALALALVFGTCFQPEAFANEVHPNAREKVDKILKPIVQISDGSSVGSGVVALSRKKRFLGSLKVENYIFTADHVVRDILKSRSDQRVPITVYEYNEDGSKRGKREYRATVVERSSRLDFALLRVVTSEKLPAATLPSIKPTPLTHVFDCVYAVGCPLGNDPIPTAGEVCEVGHLAEGVEYTMINSPTYIGNSGGGVFKKDTMELLGIYSRVYTHGSSKPKIVPHMGLYIPIESIYDFLRERSRTDLVRYDSIVPVEATVPTECESGKASEASKTKSVSDKTSVKEFSQEIIGSTRKSTTSDKAAN